WSGPDWERAERVAGAVGDDGHHELCWECAKWFLQLEFDGVFVERRDGLQGLVRALARRDEVRIEKAAERIHHVAGGELVAIMKAHTAAEMGDICQWIGNVEPHRQPGRYPQLVVDRHELAVDELMDLLGILVGADARIEVDRGLADDDLDDVRIARRRG